MRIQFTHDIEVVDGDYMKPEMIEIVADIILPTEAYYDCNFGNYLPGNPAKVVIEEIALNGVILTIVELAVIADANVLNLNAELENKALATYLKFNDFYA